MLELLFRWGVVSYCSLVHCQRRAAAMHMVLSKGVFNYLLSESGLSLALYPDQATSVRALQLGSNIAVCPSEMFVVYVSVLCDDAFEGKKSLHAVMDRLFSVHTLDTAYRNSTD
ncbi:rab escort protein [Artemisia annua]|uniref:Rab escort protein n=1 Tax=Artemisia annua TaxID=35608 RepID=A0A2U1PYJ2_ARTAN|nr:rab escort protein [Artemisia annua]